MTDAPQPHAETTPGQTILPAVIHLPDLSRDVPPLKARRGSDTRQRQHVEQFRADDAEHAALEARARDSGLSVGAYVRSCALGDAGPRSRRQSRLPAIDVKELARNNAELNWIGSNLNQAVRALNEIALEGSSGGLAQMAHLTQPIHRVLDELRLTLAANRRALGHDREG
jgi:hypothetical protein